METFLEAFEIFLQGDWNTAHRMFSQIEKILEEEDNVSVYLIKKILKANKIAPENWLLES